MGVKATLRHGNVPNDVSNSAITDRDPTTAGSTAGVATSSCRAPEKQASQRRKVDSVLDDIMGDPDDFRDLADSDAESDGGRWEDAVRAALEHEEAGVGAVHPEIRNSEDGLCKSSGEANVKISIGITDPHHKHSPHSIGDPEAGWACGVDGNVLYNGCSGQNGEEIVQENGGQKHSSNALTVGTWIKESKVYQTKYFIIKSLNHHNIAMSIEKGIWATQAMNEPVLNEAFECAERVLLVFSVNMSGHFQGYAKMTSPIGRRRANVWSEANEGANPWGGTFSVDWLCLYDLPFQKTVHLKNPLNFFKPVKISRDCQELAQDVGDALCALIDEGADRDGRPNRKVTMADVAAFSSKRKRKDSMGVLDDGSQSRQQISSSQNGGMRFPAVYPPNIPAGVVHEPFPSPGPIHEGLSSKASLEAHKGSKSKSPHPASSERSLNKERDNGRNNRHRGRERPSERDRLRDHTHSSSSGCSADLPVEEDLLNMTYEEYLQRRGHSKECNNAYQQGAGPFFYNSSSPGYKGSWKNAGMDFQEEYSNYITNWYSRQGPSIIGDAFYCTNGTGNSFPVNYPPDAPWIGQADEVRERRPARSADGKALVGYPEHNGPSSRHIERISRAHS